MTSYPQLFVHVCLAVYDFTTSDDKETTDFVFFTKPDHVPVMVPKQETLNRDHIIEISNQAGISSQKFFEDLSVVQRIKDQKNI